MRYQEGAVVISPKVDIPILRYVRNCRFVTRQQLYELLERDSILWSRDSFKWRLARLLRGGYIQQVGRMTYQSSPVYTIARTGLLELESTGESAIVLHSKTKHMPHQSQVFHALELTGIRLALARNRLLVQWQPEVEIASANMVVSTPYAKDYDAIVDVWVDNEIRRFALEYERSLKGLRQYEKIKAAIEADVQVPSVLYLTTHCHMVLALLCELTPSSKLIGFATATSFREQLLSTQVATGTNLPVVSLKEFLRYSHPLYSRAV